MAIAGVGTTCDFYYNRANGQWSGTDELSNLLVKYYNGELTEDEVDNLNNYDRLCMYTMEGVEDWQSFSRVESEDVEGAIIKVTYLCADYNVVKLVDETGKESTATFSSGMTAQEVEDMLDLGNNYETTQHMAFDRLNNCGTITPGDQFDVDGWKLVVTNSTVRAYNPRGVEDYSNTSIANMAGALDFFIRFTNGQMDATLFEQEDIAQIRHILKSMGFDLTKEFKVNQLTCKFEDGRISDVGNETGLARNVYESMRNRGLALYKLSNKEVRELQESGAVSKGFEINYDALTKEQYNKLFVDEYMPLNA